MVIRGVESDPPLVGPKDELKTVDWNPPTTPEELEQLRKQREEIERNAAVFEGLMHEIYSKYRGQFVCIVGGELFVGPDNREVRARAEAAHPDISGGFFHMYIRRKDEAGYF